jgi:transposase InsO family protein
MNSKIVLSVIKGRYGLEGILGYKQKLFELFILLLGGHSDMLATYHRVKKQFTWSGMKPAVEFFLKQCQVCQQAKHEHCKLPGLLSPLKPPEGAWQAISPNFIEGLPNSHGYNCILVVVDRFTKYNHSLPLKHPFTAASVAKEFMDKVIKLHCIPVSIVPDRDKVFSSTFWRELFKILDTKLQMSLAYHPQTDGHMERTNQCLEMYLRCAIHDQPKKWSQWQPLAELWFNTSHHSALGCSPFKTLYGHEPNMGFVPAVPNTTNTDVFELLQERALFSEYLKSQLHRAQQRMKLYADRHSLNGNFWWAKWCL